jgi:hypothetical protein
VSGTGSLKSGYGSKGPDRTHIKNLRDPEHWKKGASERRGGGGGMKSNEERRRRMVRRKMDAG